MAEVDGLAAEGVDGEVEPCGAVWDTLAHGVGNTVVLDGTAGVVVVGETVVVVSGATVVAEAHGSPGTGETSAGADSILGVGVGATGVVVG
ncbi:hypothetical protein [Rhodococcus sp. 14-2470-1a]|uniref:hypothetical protein n=1 Tax=Rhodococcus sp. 14-2470-1a TaxID=2023150 RepID=UPI0015C5FED7|nr:hypothetical protein [Rhodococcus sp. 14-2470-1a]